jgi:gliding motility-associated lipoprotein GldD
MIILIKNKLIILVGLFAFFLGCREVNVPKPKGYFRIDLPVREYLVIGNNASPGRDLPMQFEFPSYGRVTASAGAGPGDKWFNIEIKPYHATIYFTYIDIHDDLDSLMEQNYRINIRNHVARADAINEIVIDNPGNNVYGILYDLKGNTATAVQFFVTDSIRHYLRGSLYFSAEPNPDSLEPLTSFFREDIVHLIETLRWNAE